MAFVHDLIFSPAFAQAAVEANGVTPPAGAGTSVLMNMVPLLLIFGVFYILIIRPQQKQQQQQVQFVKALKKGDRVQTVSGFAGTIHSCHEGDSFVMLEVSPGVTLKLYKTHIAGVEDMPVTGGTPSAGQK